MDKELKAKWVAALRSGTYKQGNGILRTHLNEYCCLGVLCDLYDRNKWDVRRELSRAYYGSNWAFPHDLEGVQGMPLKEEMSHLASMNDGGKSFAQIADYIEANL